MCNCKVGGGRNWNTTTTVCCILIEHSFKKKVVVWWVPHALIYVQKQKSLKIGQEHLKWFRRGENFLNQIIVIDETRIWNFKPQLKSQNNVWKLWTWPLSKKMSSLTVLSKADDNFCIWLRWYYWLSTKWYCHDCCILPKVYLFNIVSTNLKALAQKSWQQRVNITL